MKKKVKQALPPAAAPTPPRTPAEAEARAAAARRESALLYTDDKPFSIWK